MKIDIFKKNGVVVLVALATLVAPEQLQAMKNDDWRRSTEKDTFLSVEDYNAHVKWEVDASVEFEPLAQWQSELEAVRAFQTKFSTPMASEPAFLNPEAFEFRLKFMQEELDEFRDDHDAGNMKGAADALVDLAYVLYGTVLMMGLPWQQLWDEVQRKNMEKQRVANAGESKRGTQLDVIKPQGWTPPDHTPALGDGPWPIVELDSTLTWPKLANADSATGSAVLASAPKAQLVTEAVAHKGKAPKSASKGS